MKLLEVWVMMKTIFPFWMCSHAQGIVSMFQWNNSQYHHQGHRPVSWWELRVDQAVHPRLDHRVLHTVDHHLLALRQKCSETKQVSNNIRRHLIIIIIIIIIIWCVVRIVWINLQHSQQWVSRCCWWLEWCWCGDDQQGWGESETCWGDRCQQQLGQDQTRHDSDNQVNKWIIWIGKLFE